MHFGMKFYAPVRISVAVLHPSVNSASMCSRSCRPASVFLLACSLLVLASVPAAHSHYAAPSAASLTIDTVGEGSVRVTLADRRSATGAPLAECALTFETSPGGLSAKTPAQVEAETTLAATSSSQRIDVATIAAALETSCVSSNSDYWTYELCFGKHFKQYHGSDVYMLGRTQSSSSIKNGHALMIEGGDMCGALTPPKPRSVLMNFACKKNANIPQLTSISETSTCFYEVQVATDKVCSDESFPVVTQEVQHSSAATGPLDTGSEDWYIELVEVHSAESDAESEPLLMCQVSFTQHTP
jgi:hypothetical protein